MSDTLPPAAAATLERVTAALTGLEADVTLAPDGVPSVTVAPALLADACGRMKDGAGFESNTFVTAIDHGVGAPARFEVVVQLLCFADAGRVRLRTRVEESDPVVPTITHLWPGAAYSERECYDMFGVRFEGHANLRRLLMPQAYEHHPLRKEFPHQGIEPDKLYREWDRKRRTQEGQPS